MSNHSSANSNNLFTSRFMFSGRGSYVAPKRFGQKTMRNNAGTANRFTRHTSVGVRKAGRTLSRSKVLQRATTKRPKTTKIRSGKSFGQKITLAMACTIFAAGIVVAGLGLKTNKSVEAQVKTVTQNALQNNEHAIPSEDKPSESVLRSYAVDSTLPRYIRIAKLGTYARITRQGVTSTGALKAPGNVYDAGWYENSSKPGDGGAVLLDGHVSGPTVKGVFHNIKDLQPGDSITIERGDGKIFGYSVIKKVISDVSKTDMSEALLPVIAGKPGLNLITCTGKYNSKTGSYEQRIIVFAVQQ